MALGTGAITLGQIRLEVGLGATASLADCFTAATGTFNISYAIPGVQAMSEFRGYVHGVATTSFSMVSNRTKTSTSNLLEFDPEKNFMKSCSRPVKL